METPLRLPASTSIVFDTNVLVSAFVYQKSAGQVYQYCAERYLLYTTEWLLNELRTVLGRSKFRLPAALQNEIMGQVKADSRLISPTNSLPANSSDPDDNNVLRAALFIGADFLITGDEKHLLILERVATTEIISPRTFFDRYVA